MYADIIIDITHEKLDKVFQYRVPEELEGDLRTGAGVIVPFGRGNRETKGYIVGFSETCDYDAEKIKDILRTDTSSVAIEARLVALAAWMKLWRYDDPGIENGASDQAYRAAEGTADFKKMYFQRSRRKEAGRISSQEPESAGKIDGSTFG